MTAWKTGPKIIKKKDEAKDCSAGRNSELAIDPTEGESKMIAQLIRLLRVIFFWGTEVVESYLEAFIRATITLVIGCGILFAASGFLGLITYVLVGVLLLAYMIIAGPIIIIIIWASKFPPVAKYLEIFATVIIFLVLMAYIQVRCELFGHPHLMKILGFTASLAMLGQIFFGEGIHPKDITKVAYWVTLAILIVVLPMLYLIPEQARNYITSSFANKVIVLSGARPEMLDLFLCDYNGKQEICDRGTGKRIELIKPNGDPAVFIGVYNGEPEYFNNPGKHPITGRLLRPATEDDLAITKKKLNDEDAKQKKDKQEQEKIIQQHKAEETRQEQERTRKEEARQAEEQKKIEKANAPWIVPAGTIILVKVGTPEISSESKDQAIWGELAEPVMSGENIAIAGGQTINMDVVAKKGTPSSEPILSFAIANLPCPVYGRSVRPKAELKDWVSVGKKPSTKSKLGKFFGSLAAGAVTGGIIDGKKGAAIGAGGGSIVGMVIATKTGANQLYVRAGDILKFELTQDLIVPKK